MIFIQKLLSSLLSYLENELNGQWFAFLMAELDFVVKINKFLNTLKDNKKKKKLKIV